ncbi:MAG: uracil-DNA glycosylase [Rickettsiales bacterium]|jgi:DNA polymerase|nr:uracil-DNA glycosylase [Rickettsiales bacterium]
MGLNSLRDLELSGVRWELSENQGLTGPSKKQNTISQESSVIEAAPSTPAGSSTASDTMIPALRPVVLSSAVESANGAADTTALCTAISAFNHPLKQFVKNTVLPHFTNSDLLIITDAPGADDDDNAKILTGAAGELMNKMLSAIGLSRDNVSIVPLVFWRTPGGRTASREELDLAKPFVDRALSLLKSKAILTLGILTASEIANAKLPKDHGNLFATVDGIPVFPIYHPNYLMLKVDAKKDAWEALQKLEKLLKKPQESL